jgi:hypothetical protein
VYLVVIDEGTVDTGGVGGAGRHVEHVTHAEQGFGAPWSRMVRESILLDTWKEIRVGMLALMRPVMTSTDGRWVARIR